MKRRILCLMASLLLCGAVSAQNLPAYVHAHDNNMPVVAQVVLDETPVTSGWTLNAYVGDDLRGSAEIQTDLQNTYWIQVYYDTPAQGEVGPTVSFKITNGTEEYTSTTTLTAAPEGYGTLGTPQVIEFAAMQTQSVTLVAGWNWFAPTVEVSLENLEMSLGESGIIIRAFDGKFATYDEDDEEWSGNLRSLIPGQMYKIRLVSSCSPSLLGRPITNVTHTIVMGNNWFGYTNPQSMSVEDAMSNFSPVEGDRIKSSDGKFAIYEDEEWSGNLRNLTSGEGYIYVSQDDETKNLIIPAN